MGYNGIYKNDTCGLIVYLHTSLGCAPRTDASLKLFYRSKLRKQKMVGFKHSKCPFWWVSTVKMAFLGFFNPPEKVTTQEPLGLFRACSPKATLSWIFNIYNPGVGSSWFGGERNHPKTAPVLYRVTLRWHLWPSAPPKMWNLGNAWRGRATNAQSAFKNVVGW